MSLPVVLTPEAEDDLEEAALWYEQRLAGLGTRLVAQVRAAISRISDLPDLYPEVHPGIRRVSVRRFPYGVFYRRREERVEVIAILHDRRNPTVWQRRA
jgi:plasmid stabilization system protein ParE